MTEEKFEKLVNETLERIKEVLVVKGREYRRNNNPFHNFEEGARMKNISREKVLDGMLLKHEISINDMTNDLDQNKIPSINAVHEKFDDNIIYLLLKKMMFIDRIENDIKIIDEVYNTASHFSPIVELINDTNESK